ncbi:MAG TPA: recombinase family protein [Candidatus Obscuribacterales bacterium]
MLKVGDINTAVHHLFSRLFILDKFEGDRKRLHHMKEQCRTCAAQEEEEEYDPALGIRLGKHTKQHLKLIAYVRGAGDPESLDEQCQRLAAYCSLHGHTIVEMYRDPSGTALHYALNELYRADGLLVCDLSEMVQHHGDPLRDLMPLVHDEFFHNGKHLISLKEGIDTSTFSGQEQLIAYLNQLGDIEGFTC